ncbi:MAG: 4-hydroxythreonine-4-phosphate dehydrogenase PdxA [Archangium sp.]|nr:4-hydroxythreonine-4-phosphate dehydrogenase PdxA [Archangium sp.]
MKPRIAITLGDPSGIGAEITRKALAKSEVKRALTPIVFGDASVKIPNVTVEDITALPASDRKPGKPTKLGGRAQLTYILAAIDCVKLGDADAICTAPVSKEAIAKTGVSFTGHTELLAEAFGVEVMMLMRGPRLSVALATNHLSLASVPRALNTPKLARQLQFLDAQLKPLLGRRPTIAVCGLNPHAGDGGVLGKEEHHVIIPAIALARRKGVKVTGPFAADGLFANTAQKAPKFDVALAMFHDQGLVATKAVDFTRTVNVTLGLPVPRTSPDHGVAYDIAGKNVADPTPMVSALLEAAAQARARSRR